MRSRLVFFLHAVFDLFLYVGFCIVEFTDAFSKPTHEFRDFAATEKDQNSKYDEDPLRTTWHCQQKCAIG